MTLLFVTKVCSLLDYVSQAVTSGGGEGVRALLSCGHITSSMGWGIGRINFCEFVDFNHI